jgi:plastocyanin
MRLRYGLFIALTVGCGSSTSYSSNPPPAPPPPPPTNTAAVSIMNSSFGPDTTRIAMGYSVRWTNNDAISHSVTSDSANTFDSGALAGTGTDAYGPTAGGSYTRAFSVQGTYPYHCMIHTYMKGVVIVGP